MNTKRLIAGLVIAVLLLTGVAYAQIYGISNFTGVHVAGVFATATPVVFIDSLSGNAGNALEVAVAGTPAWSISAAGVESTGHPETFSNFIAVSAPTSIATATPAAVIDSLGVSVLLDVRDATTPVFSIRNGGNWVASGVGTNNNQMIVSAPTSIATAQPAFAVDSLGVSRLFEVRDAATPVMAVRNGGKTWIGKGLESAILSVACTHGAALPDFTTGMVISVTASGTPTPNDFTVGPAGSIVILLGPVGSDTCTFAKGAKMALGGATRVLGANDTLILVSDGTSWNEAVFTAGATS